MIEVGDELLNSDDYDKKNKYISLVMKIKTELPELVSMQEQGFGVSKSGTKGKDELSIMDQLHLE